MVFLSSKSPILEVAATKLETTIPAQVVNAKPVDRTLLPEKLDTCLPPLKSAIYSQNSISVKETSRIESASTSTVVSSTFSSDNFTSKKTSGSKVATTLESVVATSRQCIVGSSVTSSDHCGSDNKKCSVVIPGATKQPSCSLGTNKSAPANQLDTSLLTSPAERPANEYSGKIISLMRISFPQCTSLRVIYTLILIIISRRKVSLGAL